MKESIFSFVVIFLAFVLLLGVSSDLWSATTGKIAGKIVDKDSGEGMPGVNVLVEGTTLGGATDIEGDYFIINVPPGSYNVVATMIGYESIRKTDVLIEIDRTTRINFQLDETVIEGEEVTVVAEREVVRADVAHSEISITAEVATNTAAVSDIEDIVLLQAGIDLAGNFQPHLKGDGMGFEGISIRGGGVDETEWRMDGMSISDKRRNGVQANKISLTSVQEVQVVAGGFNAEYGDIRSGVINVVTKNDLGDRGIHANAIVKYTPSRQKHWGENYYAFTDEHSILYPYLGPNAMTGMSWNGDQIWSGWNDYAAGLPEDHPFYNHPEYTQQQFAWEHRAMPYADDPDINIDATISGPIPMLKNASFMLSHINEQIDYPYPTPRDVHKDYSTNLKVMYNISPSLKLTMNAQYGELYSVSSAFNDISPGSNWLQQNPTKWFTLNNHSFNEAAHSLVDQVRRRYSARLTKVFSPSTFMELDVQRVVNGYWAGHMRERDLTPTHFIGDPGNQIGFDERPFGWYGDKKVKDQIGYYVAGHGTRRDRSSMKSWNLNATLTSQVNKYNQVQAGVIVNADDINQQFGHNRVEKSQITTWFYNETPLMLSGYLQDKLEFQGMIANIGVRVDYSDITDQWFNPDDKFSSWYDRGMVSYPDNNNYATVIDSFQYAPASKVNAKLAVSPRIGISHPISENSKLFFNYGHFYQRPTYDALYKERWYQNGSKPAVLQEYGNPNVDMAKTVAYELGFEQNILNQFSVRIAGYYKDVTNELVFIQYSSKTGAIDYDQPESNGYRDIRGFEISLEKRAGRFFTGFLNYDYLIRSSGRIGLNRIFEDPTEAPRYYDPEQSQPVAQPKFRTMLNFNTPADQFGPRIAGFYPLAFLNANLLFRWNAGSFFTYNPEDREGVENNMQWKDYRNTDLQIGKGFNITKTLWVRAFLEVKNLLNNKYILYKPNNESISDARWEKYLGSLKEGDRVGEYDKDYVLLPRMEQLLFTNEPRSVVFGLRFGF